MSRRPTPGDLRALRAFTKAMKTMPLAVRRAHLNWLVERFYNDEPPAVDAEPEQAKQACMTCTTCYGCGDTPKCAKCGGVKADAEPEQGWQEEQPAIVWYPCGCGAEHDTPICPFGAAPPRPSSPACNGECRVLLSKDEQP